MFNLIDLTSEKKRSPPKKVANPATAEKPRGKGGKLAEPESPGIKVPKALNAYLFFSNEQIPLIKAKTNCSHHEAMKQSGVAWNAMTEEQKAPYIALQEKDKQR